MTMQETTVQQDSSTLGADLARARAARGWDVHEAAQRTGLAAKIVAGLEADAFAELGAPVFVRGYVLRYARALGLAEAPVLERFRALGLSELPPIKLDHRELPAAGPRPPRSLRPLAYVLLFAVLGYAAWRGVETLSGRFDLSGIGTLGSQGDSRQTLALPNQQRPAEPTAQTAPPAAVPPAPEPVATASPGTPPPVATPQFAAPQAAAPSAPVPVPEPPAPTAAIEAPAAPAPAAVGEARLEVVFDDDSWVEIKDAEGKVLLSGIIRKGSNRPLAGRAPFQVKLGNAQAVKLKLDGADVDPAVYLPKRGSVSRFTLGQ